MKEQFNVFGKLSNYFIDKYRAVYLILIVIVLLGYSSYSGLAREEVPETSMPMGMISVSYTGVAPEDMETLVTDVIEEAVSDIEGIDSIVSTTSQGSSSVRITFDDDVDMDDAEADMISAVSDAEKSLPADASDPVVRTANTVDRPIMEITLSGDYDLTELKLYAEDLQSSIDNVVGVSETTLTGGLDREINVYIDESKLDMYGFSLTSVASSISTYNKDYPTPSTELDTLEYSIRFDGGINTLEDIENIIVGSVNDFPLYLKDIGTVVDDYADKSSESRRYDATLQDDEMMVPTISISIQRESGADIIQASADIKQILSDGAGTVYPDDVNVIITSEDAESVNTALDNVMSNAISGLLLVIIVLFLFIGFKESIIVAFVIPISLLISFICMSYTGITLNTMSMVALILALGMLVDNAIVIMENIDRIRDEGHPIIESSRIATNQVAPAVFAATLTTISAFIPLAFMTGGIGTFMSSISYVVVFAIGASFLVSLIITPALCSRFLSKYKSDKEIHVVLKVASIVLVVLLSVYVFQGSIMMYITMIIFGFGMAYKMFVTKKTEGNGRIITAYGSLLEKVISKKINIISICIACVLILIFSITRITSGALQVELFPTEDSTTLSITAAMPTAYLIDDALIIAEQIEDDLYKYPEILNVVSKISSSSVSVSVEIVDEELRDLSSTQMMDIIRTDLSDISGAEITVGQQTRGFQGSSYPIMANIVGDDSYTVTTVAEDLVDILNQIEGTTEVSSSLTGGPPELIIELNEEVANMYGITMDTLSTTLNQKISGVNATDFVLEGEEVSVYVKYEGDTIDSISDFDDITFETKDGTTVYFSQIADVVESKGVTSISHQDLQRIESVNSNLLDGYNATEVTELFETAIENYDVPNNISIETDGTQRDIQESFTSLGISMVLAIILVFIILSVQFNSLLQPMIILCAVPLATIGAIWGLILTGNNFGTYAFFGIVSLVGIAINDAIVLVDYINYLRAEGQDIKSAIIEGGKTRFIPVFSTTITTVGGILPLALRDASYAQLGYSLIFGLLVATVLTLIVIPMLYLVFETGKVKFKKIIPILIDERL